MSLLLSKLRSTKWPRGKTRTAPRLCIPIVLGSPHDQFFFDRSDEMVSGLVQSPRLDLSNEELIKSHLPAIWLAETGADLQESLSSLLKLENHPEYPLKEGLEERLSDVEAKDKAEHKPKIMLDIIPEFEEVGWYSDNWIQDVLNRSNQVFYDSCNRWIELYKSARTQAEELHVLSLILTDHDRIKTKLVRGALKLYLKWIN